MVVHISIRYTAEGCRMLVSKKLGNKLRIGDWFEVTVDDQPRVIGDPGPISSQDLNLVTRFIHLNKHLILDYWYQEECFDSLELLQQLVKL